MKLDDRTLDAIVDAVVQRLAAEQAHLEREPERAPARCEGGEGHACTPAPRPVHRIANPIYEAMLPRLVALTTSELAVGHAGQRFLTDHYLRTREGQASARDAVHSEVPEGWAAAHGLLALKTRCRERREYLLYPNLGRRLDEPSLALLAPHSRSAPDVQLIVGDGLSPNAIVQNGAQTLEALRRAVAAAGWRTGPDLYVKFARIGVADEAGVLLGARATVMLVGERPGLGAGDSLSVYLAVNPRLDQDNAEKNCISNVRPIGIAPDEAAAQSVTILERSFAAGVGGVALGVGWGRK